MATYPGYEVSCHTTLYHIKVISKLNSTIILVVNLVRSRMRKHNVLQKIFIGRKCYKKLKNFLLI